MRIFLTGFMGSGKTYVGKQLAQLLQLPFIDLDDIIEQDAQKSIAQIFAQEGEEYFRQLESRHLRFLEKYESVVVATGGGTPCHDQNMAWINRNGLSIFLDVAIPILVQRLAKEKDHRPLIQSLNDVELAKFVQEKRASRLECYRSAMVIYQQNEAAEDVTRHLYANLPNIKGH